MGTLVGTPAFDKQGNSFSARVFRRTMAEETSAGGAAEQEQQLLGPAEPQDLPECPICSEALEPQQRPAMLPGCGHTLCRRCLLAIARQEELLRCPFCRRTTNLRLDHLDVPITITSPEPGAHYASLLHKLLGCCVDAPPWTLKGLRVILLLLLLGCLLYVIVPVLVLVLS